MNVISVCLGFLCIGSFMYLLALSKYASYSPIQSAAYFIGYCILLFVLVFITLKSYIARTTCTCYDHGQNHKSTITAFGGPSCFS